MNEVKEEIDLLVNFIKNNEWKRRIHMKNLTFPDNFL